jgi:outer membrane protein OmpA-like peptidoglycan-associated protein
MPERYAAHLMLRRIAPALLVLALSQEHALAQDREGMRIDRFRPPPSTRDGVGIELAPTLGHLTPSFGLLIDYANQPLVVRSGRSAAAGAIVSHRIVAHVLAALGVTDRLQFHLRIPVVFQVGDRPTISGVSFGAPDVATLADMSLGGAVRLLGDAPEDFHLGVMAEALIPSTTATSGYASDREFSARGALLADAAMSGLRLELSLGASYRPERQLESLRTASELDAQLGLLVPAHPAVDLFFELTFASGLRGDLIFQAQGSSLELMLGSRMRLGGGACVDLGVGAGFLRAPGTPAVRALASFRWETPPAGPGDVDGDLILDDVDACPSEPEDVDQWRDLDGCPEPDDDDDGVLDASDHCRQEAEDVDGFEDADGCPDLDNDADEVADSSDACPNVPGDPSARGCPVTLRTEGHAITLLRVIEFALDRATLVPADGIILDELASFMQFDHGARWRILVRPEARGRRDDGVELARARADAIVHSLVARGVSDEALEAGAAAADATEFVSLETLEGASE